MVKEIKSNDERLKEIIFENKQLDKRLTTLETTYKQKFENLELNYKEKIDSYDKSQKITISKLNRLTRKIKNLSFSNFITYLFLIAVGVIIYLKLFK